MNLTDHLPSTSWQGKVKLIYQYKQEKTSIKSSFAQAPFKLQSPFYPEGDNICHSVILHTAGGIVGGDYLQQEITLEPQAEVFITTPAATKIYGSDKKKAFQNIEINLKKDSYLEYFPQEIIFFNQAHFQQKVKINLEENALYLGWEIVRFGRTARKEIVDQGQWLNYVEIWQGEKPLWIDRQKFRGDTGLFFSPNGLAGQPVVANLVMVGKEFDSDLINEIRSLWREEEITGQWGVTALQKGLLCRYQGFSVSESKKYLLKIWRLLRAKEGKSPLIKPRFWQ